MEQYDYIVVGAGSAGAALAARLSENPNNSVLLVEAGRASHMYSWLPVSFGLLIHNPAANWLYESEPEEVTGNRKIPVPRGKLLGGSSAINGLVWVRGQPLDYNTWAQMGARGWSWRETAEPRAPCRFPAGRRDRAGKRSLFARLRARPGSCSSDC